MAYSKTHHVLKICNFALKHAKNSKIGHRRSPGNRVDFSGNRVDFSGNRVGFSGNHVDFSGYRIDFSGERQYDKFLGFFLEA